MGREFYLICLLLGTPPREQLPQPPRRVRMALNNSSGQLEASSYNLEAFLASSSKRALTVLKKTWRSSLSLSYQLLWHVVFSLCFRCENPPITPSSHLTLPQLGSQHPAALLCGSSCWRRLVTTGSRLLRDCGLLLSQGAARACLLAHIRTAPYHSENEVWHMGPEVWAEHTPFHPPCPAAAPIPHQITRLSQPCLQDRAEKGMEQNKTENNGVLLSPLWGHFASPQTERSQF